jgi:hypothetical protein
MAATRGIGGSVFVAPRTGLSMAQRYPKSSGLSACRRFTVGSQKRSWRRHVAWKMQLRNPAMSTTMARPGEKASATRATRTGPAYNATVHHAPRRVAIITPSNRDPLPTSARVITRGLESASPKVERAVERRHQVELPGHRHRDQRDDERSREPHEAHQCFSLVRLRAKPCPQAQPRTHHGETARHRPQH